MDSSRKLPKNLDNPIDNFILDYIVDPLNPLFYKIGMTPNKLTGLSGIFGLLSVYCIYKSNYIRFFPIFNNVLMEKNNNN